jgi:chemotaxis signal transduction protein
MVKTIQRLEDYQPLPLTRASIVGVINALGRLLVVLDLRSPPQVAARAGSPAGKPVIVAGPDGSEVGLVVDALVAAPGFPAEHLQPTVTTCTGKELSDA